ncbi:MAG: SxtJ family membrane protein, partial [Sinobacterium sp.]
MLTLVDKSDIRELKSFARTMIWAFPAIFMGLLPWIFERDIHWWPSVISAVLGLLYLLYPAGIYYPYRVWMLIAGVLGWINTRLILGMAFYLSLIHIS